MIKDLEKVKKMMIKMKDIYEKLKGGKKENEVKEMIRGEDLVNMNGIWEKNIMSD